MTELQTIELCPGGVAPAATLIVLHGLGADGTDFIPMCDALDLSAVGPVRCVMPRAPVRPVTINGGYVMRAWYDILAPGGRGGEDEAGLRASQRLIEGLIGREIARGLPASRIVLAGFSQGGAIAFQAGLRHPERLAGIMALSTYLPLAETLDRELSDANDRVPIFMAHGSYDPMIPMIRAQHSRDALMALGYPVEWREYPMPHSVCAEEISDIRAFLLNTLGHSQA